MSKSIEILPVSSYYNFIAGEYNDFMVCDSNLQLREIMKKEFMETVPQGTILDFGGGTGLDLAWMIGSTKYKIIFLEPAVNMRKLAQQSIPEVGAMNNLTILEQGTDISQWSEDKLPFYEKIDGLLANFAVLNCIKNIDEFFEKIALVCNKGCHIVAAVLDSRFHVAIKEYPIKTKLSAISGAPMVVYGSHQGKGHTTYIHRVSEFKSASRKHFDFVSCTPLGLLNFSILKLTRK